jgi:YD repeat-containing protein
VYTYDDAGRLRDSARQGYGTTIGTLTTRYTYDAAGRVLQEQSGTLAGSNFSGETLTTSRTFDNAGRITSEAPPGLGATTTSYNTAAGTRIVTYPSGGSRIETSFSEGLLQSVTGSAVVAEYYTYDVDQATSVRHQCTNYGSPGSPRLRETWTDMIGRTVKTSRPGFTGQSANVEQSFYDDNTGGNTGRLVKTTRTGHADTLYQYDEMSQVKRTGLDVDGNGSLDLALNDRIDDTDQHYEQDNNGGWWLTKIATTYPTANSGTPLITSTTRTRLTGFSGGVQAETKTTDVNNIVTDRTETVNAAAKAVTTTTAMTATDINYTKTEVDTNGLSTSVTGFDGLTYTTGYDALLRPNTSTDPRTGTTTTYYKTGSSLVWKLSAPIAADGTYGYVATYTYDNAGRRTAVTDAAGKVAYTAYDTLSHVVNQWGDTTYPVQYGYDTTYGDRISMSTFRGGSGWIGATWPSTTGTADTTTWTYDGPSGLLARKTDASGNYVQSTYNAAGQTATRTLARGVTTTYGYDTATGELLSQTYSDSTPAITYTYTRAGQPDTVADVTGTRSFVYNTTNPLQLDAVDLPAFYASRILTRDYNDAIKRPTGFRLGNTSNLAADFTQAHVYSGTTSRFDHLTATPVGQSAREFDYSYTTNSSLVAGYTTGSFAVSRGYESNRDLLTSIDSQWSTASALDRQAVGSRWHGLCRF